MVVIGAGIIGVACAYHAAVSGLDVAVVDRGPVAGGSTGAGEGNLLISDKEPGPELDLALYSSALWREFADGHGADFEYEPKGGLIVARDTAALSALAALASRQRSHGVEATAVPSDGLADLEPHLARGLAGGVFFPQDAQVQPMLAAAWLLKLARERGAVVHIGVTVTGLRRGRDGRVTAVQTTAGELPAGAVVNAAGVWAGDVAALAGVALPMSPRRGFILVTEPLPATVRHKVYGADYVSNVASDSAGLETSPVVEGTRAGTVLIGASRERVGFDRTFSIPVLSRLAAQAVALFPFLARVSAIRAYCGFRPYLPDHLPAIGADRRAPGLLHACGHEGAGIGLAMGTGKLVAQLLTGATPDLDLAPYALERFDEEVR